MRIGAVKPPANCGIVGGCWRVCVPVSPPALQQPRHEFQRHRLRHVYRPRWQTENAEDPLATTCIKGSLAFYHHLPSGRTICWKVECVADPGTQAVVKLVDQTTHGFPQTMPKRDSNSQNDLASRSPFCAFVVPVNFPFKTRPRTSFPMFVPSFRCGYLKRSFRCMVGFPEDSESLRPPNRAASAASAVTP